MSEELDRLIERVNHLKVQTIRGIEEVFDAKIQELVTEKMKWATPRKSRQGASNELESSVIEQEPLKLEEIEGGRRPNSTNNKHTRRRKII